MGDGSRSLVMPADEGLLERIRAIMGPRDDVEERNMMGGRVFMVRGNMSIGAKQEKLLLRMSAEAVTEALTRPHTEPIQKKGQKPLSTMMYVLEDGFTEDEDLTAWVELAVREAEALPPK